MRAPHWIFTRKRRQCGKLQAAADKHATWRHVAVASLLVPLLSCRSGESSSSPNDANYQVRRSVQSFVHCVEQSGPACVGSQPQQRAFGSFAALVWLQTGSPLTLLSWAEQVLSSRQDLEKNQVRFVGQVSQLYNQIRGASCEPVAIVSNVDALATLQRNVKARLDGLDLWPGQRDELIQLLHAEANAGLGKGYVTAVACEDAPWLFYLVTALEGDGQAVVGMSLSIPSALVPTLDAKYAVHSQNAGITANRKQAEFYQAQEGLVHPWIKVPVEEM